MIRRILMVALAALLTLSSSAALASSSPKNLLETARPSEYQVIPIQVQVGENEQANSYGPLNSYIVECALALAVSETTNSSWTSFYDHYLKHRSEWSPSLTQMQYLQKARSLAAKAYDADRYPNFLVVPFYGWHLDWNRSGHG